MVILGNEEEGWNPGQGHMSHQRGQKTIFFRFQPQFVTVFFVVVVLSCVVDM